MYNFFAIILITVISLLPSTPKTNDWETIFRNKIDKNQAKTYEAEKNDYKPIPESVDEFKLLSSSAKAAYFVDINSGKVLYEKNGNQKLPPASTVKLMTAIITVTNTKLNSIITIKPQNTQLNDSTMGLVYGDRITVKELLHGLLINSGSDASLNLATHISGSEISFVKIMNQKAKIFGLENTNFTNPVGWDEAENYSTAKDLTILAKIALQNDLIKEIVSKNNHISRSENGNFYYLKNTNLTLGSEGYFGIKTGTTYNAGENFIVYYKDESREIIGTVLNSTARFEETKKIIEWTKGNYSW